VARLVCNLAAASTLGRGIENASRLSVAASCRRCKLGPHSERERA